MGGIHKTVSAIAMLVAFLLCLSGCNKNQPKASTTISAPINNSQVLADSNVQSSNKITITVGKEKVEALLDDSLLAQEIKNMLPLTISMYNYKNREFYGHMQKRSNNQPEGSFNFKNGDLTYCAQNNSLALFYNKDQEVLTMKVVRIGRITSDLQILKSMRSESEEVKLNFSK